MGNPVLMRSESVPPRLSKDLYFPPKPLQLYLRYAVCALSALSLIHGCDWQESYDAPPTQLARPRPQCVWLSGFQPEMFLMNVFVIKPLENSPDPDVRNSFVSLKHRKFSNSGITRQPFCHVTFTCVASLQVIITWLQASLRLAHISIAGETQKLQTFHFPSVWSNPADCDEISAGRYWIHRFSTNSISLAQISAGGGELQTALASEMSSRFL